jgi:hypothetical protein
MTFGKNSGNLWFRLPVVVFIWSVMSGLAPMSLAGISPQTERGGGSNGWTVERLMDNLAKHRQAEARFAETTFSSLLTEPLKTQGILRFTPPATLEKHVTAPQDERYLIEGDHILFENKAKSINRTLSLQDYPALQAFVEAFRSTLTNDVVTLRRFFRVTLQGESRRWVLILLPLDHAAQELVESIRFSGEEGHVSRIEILAPDGDRSVMVITTGAP